MQTYSPAMIDDLSDAPESVAARLRRVREVLALSKREFAERACVTEQTCGPFENAKRPLSLDAAKKLRDQQGCELRILFIFTLDCYAKCVLLSPSDRDAQPCRRRSSPMWRPT